MYDGDGAGPVVKISKALKHALIAICSQPITNLGKEDIIMTTMMMMVSMMMMVIMIMIMMTNLGKKDIA